MATTPPPLPAADPAAETASPQSKHHFRALVRDRRDHYTSTLPLPQRRALDKALISRLYEAIAGYTSAPYALYVPVGSEPGATLSLDDLCSFVSSPAFFPTSENDGSLRWGRCASAADFWVGRFAIPEPRTTLMTTAEIADQGLAVVVIPAMALGKDGSRLGKGAGFYDRFLADLRRCGASPLLVGVSYDHEVFDSVPTEAHDQPLDMIVTPSKLYFCQRVAQ